MKTAVPLMLVRVEPPSGRGEQIALNRLSTPAPVGRAEESAVRLLTASASRRHAALERDETGIWWITPEPGKELRVDGETLTTRCSLEAGLNLQLGGDRFRCVVVSETSAAPAALRAEDEEREGPGWAWGAAGLIGLLALAGLGWVLFSRPI